MRNLCIFIKFLQVTYTHFVLGDIDFKKSVRISLILPKKYLGLVSERTECFLVFMWQNGLCIIEEIQLV